MGGMIAQLLAIRHPDRVRSLVSITSTGESATPDDLRDYMKERVSAYKYCG